MKVYIVQYLEGPGVMPINDKVYLHRSDAEAELAKYQGRLMGDFYEIGEYELVGDLNALEARS